jgi:thioredoxin 2
MVATRHVVCPHCGRKNRFPVGGQADTARCGACHKALFEGKPVSVDAEQFERHRQGDEIALLVDIWAPWCGPCRIMGPMFEGAAAELEPHMRLLWVNAEEEPQLAAKLGVRGIPALLLIKDGQIVAHTAGAMDTRRIVEWARAHLAKEAA